MTLIDLAVGDTSQGGSQVLREDGAVDLCNRSRCQSRAGAKSCPGTMFDGKHPERTAGHEARPATPRVRRRGVRREPVYAARAWSRAACRLQGGNSWNSVTKLCRYGTRYGQNPRRLQWNATGFSWQHVSHLTRGNPCWKRPHSRYPSNTSLVRQPAWIVAFGGFRSNAGMTLPARIQHCIRWLRDLRARA